MEVADAYVNVSEVDALSRIGLRYVNQLSIADGQENESGQITIDSIITLDPPIPEDIEQPLAQFHQIYVLVHGDVDSILTHQTLLQPPVDAQNTPHIILDIDFYTQSIDVYAEDRVRQWLSVAHERVSKAFVASINPSVLASMKGNVDDSGYTIKT